MKLIIINGPMGVGKTTLGKYIAEHNEGTAFIDGDWCLDIHPFVGNKETKSMAVDNILHMIGNYRKCSACKMIVLVWLMDDEWVYKSIIESAGGMGLEVKNVTLICDKDELVSRWKNDKACEWRTDEWLKVSLRSLALFTKMDNTLDTSGISIEQLAETVCGE